MQSQQHGPCHHVLTTGRKSYRKRNHCCLKDQSSLAGDPVGEAGHTGESSWNLDFAALIGTETDDAYLIVDAVVDETQRAARVTLP